MAPAAFLLGSYVIGSVPFGYWLCKLVKGIDVRQAGSGNIGFTNVWRVAGPPLACLVFALDLAKGMVPTLIAHHFLPGNDVWRLLVGSAAIAGHNWSLFLKFKGGRGVCTTLGVLFALTPAAAAFTFVVWLTMVLTTRYVSLGSIAGSIAYPAVILVTHHSTPLVVFSLLAGAAVIARHVPNIKRLLRGEENKFGRLKGAADRPPTEEQT
ncbi:MAG: acyl-phosphate glycerol 3-phosphate acyltransferase [Armatimonadetes bacterium CG2_30_66_41]|nr:MAG: acyl-phosphate glycerol 3-phosphate acyltransferase [Armatimonadetes bacterium CG2_30_66_41]